MITKQHLTDRLASLKRYYEHAETQRRNMNRRAASAIRIRDIWEEAADNTLAEIAEVERKIEEMEGE